MATVFKGFKYCNELAGARGGAIGEMWCMYDGGNIGINKLSVKRGDFVSWGVNGWKLEPNMKFLTTLDSFDMSQLAPEYRSLTFPIAEGTLCMYARRLYTCSASGGIPTSEDWDSTHWTQTKVSEIIGNVEQLLAAL